MKHLLALVLVTFALSANGEGGTFAKESSSQVDVYGALAYDGNTRAWAYAVNLPEKGRATGIVAKLCGPACEVYGPFEQCAAVAANGMNVGYGYGMDKPSAEASARNKCGGNCDVVVWKCNQQTTGEEFGYRRETNYPKNYGAVVYDASSGAYGTVWDQASFADAIAVAKGNCGKNCRVYAVQADGCSMLARGGNSIASGSGGDYKTAEDAALAKCGDNSCKAVSWFCNSPPK